MSTKRTAGHLWNLDFNVLYWCFHGIAGVWIVLLSFGENQQECETQQLSCGCATQGLLCLRYILDWKVDTDKVRRKEIQELQDVSAKAKEGGTTQSDQTHDTKAQYGALDV